MVENCQGVIGELRAGHRGDKCGSPNASPHYPCIIIITPSTEIGMPSPPRYPAREFVENVLSVV